MSELLHRIVTITGIRQETPSVFTIRFDYQFTRGAGQFVMVWVPGVDEIPMALSFSDGITVQNIGEATNALCSLSPGNKIGIRGPFGKGFSPVGKVMVIAGGVGAAPLIQIAEEHPDVQFLLGARTAEELVAHSYLSGICDLHIATDDGSKGHHGYVVDLLDTIAPQEMDTICVCGPELMMSAVLRNLNDRGILSKGQFSLHRYMKCGVGLCGSCCMDDDGMCVCHDGPVFSGPELLSSEFGSYHRDASGRRLFSHKIR